MESFRALLGRGEQFLHRAHGTIVQIRRARPRSRQSCGKIFSGAAHAEFLGRLVADGFQFGEKFVEAIGLSFGEKFGAMWISSNCCDREQTPIALRASMA